MLHKCCLIHIDVLLGQFLYLVYLCLPMGLSLPYPCASFCIFVFISITINPIILLRQTNFFLLILYSCSQKFSLSMLLSFSLIFSQFQPGVVYESVTYIKTI